MRCNFAARIYLLLDNIDGRIVNDTEIYINSIHYSTSNNENGYCTRDKTIDFHYRIEYARAARGTTISDCKICQAASGARF